MTSIKVDSTKTDTENWATCSKEDQAKIAKIWATRYSIKELRSIQTRFERALTMRYKQIDPHDPTPDTEFDSYRVRLNIATAAVYRLLGA